MAGPHLRWIALKLPRMKRNCLRRHCSAPLRLLPFPALGRRGQASSDGRYGISPVLKPRLHCSLSWRRRHPPVSCICALSSLKSSLSSAATVAFTNIPPIMRRSVFYPLAHFVAYHVTSLHACVGCARYHTNPTYQSPLLDASASAPECTWVGEIAASPSCFSRRGQHRSILGQHSGCSHPETTTRSSGLATTGFVIEDGCYLPVGAFLVVGYV